VKVPKVSQEPHALPIANAREKSIHQDNPNYFGRVLRGVSVGDHQSDVVTDNSRAPKSERRCEGMNVLRHRLLVVAAIWFGRLTESAQVWRDNRSGLRQFNHQRPPHPTGFGIAMQQNHRIAVSGDQIVKPDLVDFCETILDPLLCMNGDVGCHRKNEKCDATG
jgi:hypothetical protein